MLCLSLPGLIPLFPWSLSRSLIKGSLGAQSPLLFVTLILIGLCTTSDLFPSPTTSTSWNPSTVSSEIHGLESTESPESSTSPNTPFTFFTRMEAWIFPENAGFLTVSLRCGWVCGGCCLFFFCNSHTFGTEGWEYVLPSVLSFTAMLLNPVVGFGTYLSWLGISSWQSCCFFLETYLHLPSSIPHSPDFPSVSLAIPSQSPLLFPSPVSNKVHITVSQGSVPRSPHFCISFPGWFCGVSWI